MKENRYILKGSGLDIKSLIINDYKDNIKKFTELGYHNAKELAFNETRELFMLHERYDKNIISQLKQL